MTRRFATPLDLRDADEAFRQRFWLKVAVAGPDDCWLWTAYRKPGGYGQIKAGRGLRARPPGTAHAQESGSDA